MKTLIFSDTHLTHKFDSKKYQFLKGIIEPVDRVIINGDFWDGYFTNFERFVNSEWKRLFPLLKTRDTVYLYGNHDPEWQMDERVELFCNTLGESYEMDDFHIEHGNRFYVYPDERVKIPRGLMNFFKKLMMPFYYYETFGFRLFGSEFEKVYRKSAREKVNRILFESSTELRKEKLTIFGHSHRQSIRLNENFIVLGPNAVDLGNYLVINDGRLEVYNSFN